MRIDPLIFRAAFYALMLLSSIVIAPAVKAQSKPSLVTGVVTNNDGDPLQGVSVIIRNTKTNFTAGTSTDSSGLFSFSRVSPGGPYSFAFSTVGYETQPMSGYSIKEDVTLSLVVKMQPTMANLDQVVVVGYGTQRRKDLTGSVASVGNKDIKDLAVTRLDQALMGKIAGVQVKPVSGEPGAAPQVRVRGIGSISAGSTPLYVVDGFPMSSIETINPNDIESIDVLKDASASAIYGSRGSNGVIIVNTKKGRSGKAVISFDSYYGWQKVSRRPKFINAMQLAQYFYDGVKNRNIDAGNDVSGAPNAWRLPVPPIILDVLSGKNTTDVDKVAAVLQTAPVQQYQLGVSGGSENVRYAVSGEYMDQDGIVINSNFKRYSIRANVDAKVSKRL